MEMTRSEWLLNRQKGIGGSDISAIIGLDRFMSPLQIYESKVMPIGEEKETKFMEAGKMLEDAIAKWYSLKTKVILMRCSEDSYSHPEYPHFMASPDRMIVAPHADAYDEIGVAEIKNTYLRIDEPLESWLCQLQWYLFILDKKVGTIIWLTQGNTLEYRDVQRNDELIEYLKEEADKFWREHVLAKVPPPPISLDDIHRTYKISRPGQAVPVNSAVYDLCCQLADVKGMIAEKELEKDSLEAQIKLVLCDGEILVYGDEILATWKTTYPKPKFDEKGFSSQHPDLYSQHLKDSAPYRRFLLKV